MNDSTALRGRPRLKVCCIANAEEAELASPGKDFSACQTLVMERVTGE